MPKPNLEIPVEFLQGFPIKSIFGCYLFHLLPDKAQLSHVGHAEQGLDMSGVAKALLLAEVLHVAHAARYRRAGLELSAKHKKCSAPARGRATSGSSKT